jgi:hypothetical protein
MRGRGYKAGLIAIMMLLLTAAAIMQRALNHQRGDPALGFTRVAPLENAPPMLAFTTVALGGFRGLIANALWIRANELQNEGKYFEMVQLAEWITRLEPTFVQVWIVQAWNMAYNISVKFPDPQDRWRWVQRGMELLRDGGLRYNPKEALLYRELGWFFQHKMGQNLDDGHLVYKYKWAVAMTNVFGGPRPKFDELLNPTTPDARARAERLRTEYKMDPEIMREVDRLYGPLEWRLPEAHAVYWGHIGLKYSKKKDLITLRRVIYQSMNLAVLRGRLVSIEPMWFGPDLDKAEAANAAYEQMIAEETEMKQGVQGAHKNFLRQLTYLSYSHNRLAEANRWFALLKQRYPDAVQPGLSLEEFSLQLIMGNFFEMSHDRIKAQLEGLLRNYWLHIGFADEDREEEERAIGTENQARYLWNYYTQKMASRRNVLALPPFDEMKKIVLDDMLRPGGASPEIQMRLRNKLGIPAPAAEPKPPSSQ